MSDKQNKDSDMNENSVNKILLEDEIQETQAKENKDTKKKPKRDEFSKACVIQNYNFKLPSRKEKQHSLFGHIFLSINIGPIFFTLI